MSPSNFVILPFGRTDLIIIETFEPESKSTVIGHGIGGKVILAKMARPAESQLLE